MELRRELLADEIVLDSDNCHSYCTPLFENGTFFPPHFSQRPGVVGLSFSFSQKRPQET